MLASRGFTTLVGNPASLPTRSDKLNLYRSLLRTSRLYTAYNFREYVKRRAADAFRENKSLVEFSDIRAAYDEGVKSLEVAKRQGLISKIFGGDKLVVEAWNK
ncbi:hypothetical protein HDU97_001277 [Phlyctochytrium planicorne]|nr:hypothetical protein HDU97_001277 [Phlyctochytrium planicorne]